MTSDESGQEEQHRAEYEYKTVQHRGAQSLQEFLNEESTEGWRFVEFLESDVEGLGTAVFERVESLGVVRTIAERDDEEPKGLLELFNR